MDLLWNALKGFKSFVLMDQLCTICFQYSHRSENPDYLFRNILMDTFADLRYFIYIFWALYLVVFAFSFSGIYICSSTFETL